MEFSLEREKEAKLLKFSTYLEVQAQLMVVDFDLILLEQKIGWLNVACSFLEENMTATCKKVGKYLKDNKIMNEPNWDIFLKDKIAVARKSSELLKNYYEECQRAAIAQQRNQCEMIYQNELSKMSGLGFGIISSSLTAHFLYAVQAAKKENDNKNKARAIANSSMSLPLILKNAANMLIEFYQASYEPFVMDFIANFFADIELLVYNGVGVDKAQLEQNKNSSISVLENVDQNNCKEKISLALSKYPFNGEAFVAAFQYGCVDNELISFCTQSKEALSEFITVISSAVRKHIEKHNDTQRMYNRDIITDDIVAFLGNVRSFLCDNNVSATNAYDKLVTDIYGDEINSICKKFEPIVKFVTTPSSLSTYAKTHKAINIQPNEYEELKKFASIFGTQKLKNIIQVLDSENADFMECLKKINIQLNQEHDKYIKAEQERKQKEFERQQELERRRNEIKAEISKLKVELDGLGLAWFGKKAQRKAELNELISRKTEELNNIK